jgi:hypothetical protein
LGERANKRANEFPEDLGGGSAGKPEDDYPRVVRGLESERVREVDVQCDKCAPLALAVQNYVIVQCRLQVLLHDSADVVPIRL